LKSKLEATGLKMKIFLFIVPFFLVQFSQAKLAGDWIGFGNWTFKGEGEGVHCSPMQMTWSETAESIAIEKGFFDCEFVAMHLDRTGWVLKNGQLFDEENSQVGTYDGVSFQVNMPGPNGTHSIHISLRREANHYDYQEVWYNSVEKIYVIKGRFFTSEDDVKNKVGLK
jgi:hypothetical protein